MPLVEPPGAFATSVLAVATAKQATDSAPLLQVIFFPSRPGYTDPAVTRRIMDYMLFMNSKVLFKQVCCLLYIIGG